MTYRVGHGFDAHRLVPDRPFILGGVRIPYERGPLGHSDADVGLHALTDAVLGAIGAGDIGMHFPPSDPQWGEINLTPGDQYDLTGYGNTALFLDNSTQGVQLSQTTGSSCTSATGYSTDRIGIDTPPLTIGQLICIRTTEGRFSLLKILSLPNTGIVMYVTTYAATST